MSQRQIPPHHCLVVLVTVLSCGRSVLADPPKAIRVEPLAVAPGETSEIVFHGLNLEDVTDVWSSSGLDSSTLRLDLPGDTPQINTEGELGTNRSVTQPSSHKASDRVALLRASVDKTCPVGIYAVRVATVEGITNPLLFMVDDLPTLAGARENHSLETAQPIELPVAIDGVTESGQADYFQSQGRPDEWVSVEAVATRIGSKLDPVIRVLDSAGRELAFLDDSPGLSGDCRLRFQRPESGTFFVSIEDASLGGSSAYQYRLRVGDFPLVSGTLPAAVNRDQVSELRPVGPGIDDIVGQNVILSDGTNRIAVRHSEKPGSGYTKVLLSDLPQFVSSARSVLDVSLPGGLSGMFAKSGEVHSFRFAATKGDRIVLSDVSRRTGQAAMVGLAIHDESGAVIGKNWRPGTAGGMLSTTIPKDGHYLAKISEIGRRSGPEFVYYAELRRNVSDFELTLDSSSVILPIDGYAIIKVTVNRNGYNGPINLHVNGPDGALVVDGVIAAKKKDTRLKIYIPDNMQPGQTLPLTVSGSSDTPNADKKIVPVRRVASTMAVFRKSMPQTPHPPVELQNILAAVVGPSIPEFFGLSLDDGAVFFPRHVGEVYFTVRVNQRADGFTAPVALRVEGLPEGFSVSGGERAVSRSDDNEYRFLLRGPADAKAGVSEIQIVGEASFQGQTKEVTLTKLPFRIIEPLIVSAKSTGIATLGAQHQLDVTVRRFVPRAGGDRKRISLKLTAAPAGITLPNGGVIVAAKQDAQVRISVAADVRPGTYNLVLQATTEVAGHEFTVSSSPIPLVVAEQ
ncbi:MAG: hypothetical protein ABGZ23_23925 [Fuerstiella sp.]